MAVIKITHNSKRTFFGGQGSLIPLRKPTSKKPRNITESKEPTEANQTSSVSEQEYSQIAQEMREQFGIKLKGEEVMRDSEKLIELYCEGDRIGASFEGMGAPIREFSYDEIMKRSMYYRKGTDESDIVRLYLEFAQQHHARDIDKGFALDWFDYHEKRYTPTSYGRTWRAHFQLVKYLRKKGTLDYDTILELSRERNSAGNGCLAMAFPIFMSTGGQCEDVIEMIVRPTHSHAEAISCVMDLMWFFSGELTLTDLAKRDSVPQGKEVEMSPLAPGALVCAAICAQEATKEAVITKAVNMGGDVDSYLSLGLLLWGVTRSRMEG